MKTSVFFWLLLLLNVGASAQQMRYFQFNTQCGYNEWRDTSFIVATSDAAVVADVLNDLNKPVEQRKLIIGNIAQGNGGFNHNAAYTFGWHFVPNQWHLQELAMEVCDGCPYTDIDLNPTYWINQIGEFCPWTSYVSREVTHLLNREETKPEQRISFFPNPAHGIITVETEATENTEIGLLNAFGKPVKSVRSTTEIDVTGIAAGLYFISVKQGEKIQFQKVVIE